MKHVFELKHFKRFVYPLIYIYIYIYMYTYDYIYTTI